MKIKTLFMSAALMALPFAANAADLPLKAGPARSFAPAFSWTGFYLGINAGYGLASTTIDDQNCNISCSSQTLSRGGFTVGGTAGYNYQFGAGLLGLEGDWNWIDAKQSFSSSSWPSTHSAEINSFGTARVRAGLVVDKVLFYATGGVGWIDQKVSAISLCTSCSASGFTLHKTSAGLAAGAGAEFALWNGVTAKFEYILIALPSENRIPDAKNGGSGGSNVYNVKTDLHVVRAGLNYHF